MSSMVAQGLRGPQPSFKAPRGYESFSQFTPQQMDLFQSLFSHTGPESYLSRLAGGDQGAFEQAEAPALRQFNELLGGLGSRFSGMGSTGARRSSGFQNYTTSAASNFAQELQAQRQGLQRQALMDLFNMSESLLNKQPYGLMPKKRSFLEELLTGLAGGVGQGLGGLGSLAGLKGFGMF